MSIGRSSIRLIGAGAVVQALAFLLLPVISHLYSKAELGVLGTVLGIASVLGIAANGRYEQAIVMARDGIARLLFVSTVVLSLGFSLLLLPFFYLLIPLLHGLEGYVEAIPYLWIVPLLVWTMALATSLTALANQQNRYNAMARSQIAQGIANNALKVGLGYAGASVWGLLTSALAGFVAMILNLYPLAALKASCQGVSLRRMIAVCKIHSKFPRYGILQAVVDTLLGSLLVLLLPLRYDMASVGLVTMAAMVARRPLSVMSDSFSRIYCRHFAELRLDKRSLRAAWSGYVHRVLLIATPVILVLYLAMPLLVKIFLGVEWQDCTFLLRCMLPALVINFLTATFNFLPDLFGRQHLHLRVQLLMLVFESLIILIGTSILPFESFVLLYYVLVSLELIVYLCWLYTVMMQYERTLPR